ncbi:hypothetical protein DVK85_09160 [Flavobacterium arcticum]|uniref:Uncharacterized protein n=1 Tax=Flavobacterium arcticum TaxID=1784713 RepID=A0A345HCT1_9FLAO|nr:hypothetical protein [Flavobacterium arcticum]AXG74391.1 hypothetical protein DVK85_09160 [Flavobacterium arcticum]KAF2507493.1 hypothetical protein E0W72_11485 [Flavobacterium arcticum]
MENQKNTITLDTAQSWAKKWRKEEGTYNSHHEVHAFLIPKEDLIEVLEEGVDAVRAYLGVDDLNEEKLMIVGTRYDAATDTYVDMTPNKVIDAGYIYDFTRPCPPSCDSASPLNSLKTP